MKQRRCSKKGKAQGLKCTAVRCAATTRAGTRCKNYVSVFSFRCDSYRGIYACRCHNVPSSDTHPLVT